MFTTNTALSPPLYIFRAAAASESSLTWDSVKPERSMVLFIVIIMKFSKTIRADDTDTFCTRILVGFRFPNDVSVVNYIAYTKRIIYTFSLT